ASSPHPSPRISVVMPSFNQAEYLEAALESVLRQGYPDLELIVIDGGSTDGSPDILRRYGDRLSHWSSTPDRGQTDAINRGFGMATGEIVAWLNSDDAYLAGALDGAARALLDHPHVGMVYADGVMVDQQGALLDRHRYRPLETLDLLCFDVLLQPTVFMRRAALGEVGPLDESYNLIMDHDLWVRFAARHPLLHVSAEWAAERTHPQAKTVALAAGFVEEAETLIRKAGVDPRLRPMVEANRQLIRASLDAFAARRLIDAGDYRGASLRWARAARTNARVGMRYWYKAVQAGLSAAGVSRWFIGYRNLRRSAQHRRAVLVMGESGGVIQARPGRDALEIQ
ncbi:MAG: glycosyltransferase, partial [Anaerolineales bacterium]|nr:glycosyltransferase [Anaerolineales bacterium]